MNLTARKSLTAFGVAMALGLSSYGLALAQRAPAHQHQQGEEHKHGAPMHGGQVTMTKAYRFETVFTKDGLNVFPRTHEDQPIDASKLTGTATFYHPNSPKLWFERKLAPSAARRGQAATSIGLRLDLSKVPANGAMVAFRVEGLPRAEEPTARFTVPFAFTGAMPVTFTKATRADQKAIAAQRVCKISGEDLGSMGTPIKATRGDRSTFLCCPSCEEKLRADPDKYLVAAITTSKATRADQKAIAAPKTCPVSKEDLGSMGMPIKVTRGDRSVFLCCPECLKQVEADPDKYLGTASAASATERRGR